MKIYKFILGIAMLGTVAGCTGSFEEYNTNPYEPSTLPVSEFFPAMIDCLASPEENPCQRNNTFWACFGGYVKAPHSWNRFPPYATHNITDEGDKRDVARYFGHF